MQGDDKANANAVSYLARATWHYSQGNRHKVVQFMVLFTCAMMLGLFVKPFVIARIINTVEVQNATRENITTLLGFLALTVFISNVYWMLHGPARLIEQKNAFKAWVNCRSYLLKGVVTLPAAWHSDHHSGETFDQMEKGSSAIYQFAENSSQSIYAAIRLVGSFLVLGYCFHSSVLIVAPMMALTIWITVRIDKVLIPQYKRINKMENVISERIFDTVSNITTVIILRVEQLVFDAMMDAVREPYKLVKESNRLNEIKWYLVSQCCELMAALVLGSYLVSHAFSGTHVAIGEFYLLIHYLNDMNEVVFHFASVYSDMQKRKARVINSNLLADEFQKKSLARNVLPPDWKELHIKGLRFSYTNGREHHLRIDDLTLKRGIRIACVGKSGGGKSTFLKLLHGDLYIPQELEFSVDGTLIPEGFAGIGLAVALIPQDPEIFARAIEFNITLGAKYTAAEIQRCTDMALFSEVAAKLPRGLASEIKEKGVNLSGGQKQRLAVTRGIAASLGKQFVLLDEPTASLDKVTEAQIYTNILREFEGKNIIAAIHGVHLLPLFDLIYVFDEGEIIGIGTIEELIANCPKFAKLWEAAHRTHKVRRVVPKVPDATITDHA